MRDEILNNDNVPKLSRRDFIKLSALLGLSIASAEVLAACGVNESPSDVRIGAEPEPPVGIGEGLGERPLQLSEIVLQNQTIKWKPEEGDMVVNEGYFLPMTEIDTGNGKFWVPTDTRISERLAQLHDQYPPEQVGIWSQSTQDIVEATAGDSDQFFVALQLWNPGWRAEQNSPNEEWTTLLFPGDSVRGEGLAGTAWAYKSNRNGDGWTLNDFAVDVLAGIARRTHFTRIANVSHSLQVGQPGAKGLIALDQVLNNGWMQSRAQR